jgi:hypothetical protein
MRNSDEAIGISSPFGVDIRIDTTVATPAFFEPTRRSVAA